VPANRVLRVSQCLLSHRLYTHVSYQLPWIQRYFAAAELGTVSLCLIRYVLHNGLCELLLGCNRHANMLTN
jgi:hypothetical protein